MRTTLASLTLVLVLAGCGGKEGSDDASDSGDIVIPEPECAADSDCLSFEICTSDSSECIEGDRNNEVAEAEPVLWDNDTTGYLQTTDDVDYFLFTAAGGEFVRVSTEPIGTDEAMNTIVTLYDPNGKVHHVEDEHAAGSVSTFDTVLYAYLHMEGDWIIAVEDVEGHGSSTAQYNVKVTETGGYTRESDSLEQPGATVEATRANSYWAVGVNLAEAADEDWIEVELPWENCPVYVTGSKFMSGTDANPTVDLYLPDGTHLGHKEGLGPDGDAMYPEVDGKKLLIKASDSHGGGGDNHWFFVFVSIGEGGYSYTQEEEPNDELADALELETTWTTNDNGSPYGYALGWGTGGWEDDEDHFYVSVEQDQYVHIWGTADSLGSLMDADVELFSPTGESIASGTDGDDTFPDISNIGPLDAGNYTIRVRHENPETDAAGMGWWYRMTVYQTGYTVNE